MGNKEKERLNGQRSRRSCYNLSSSVSSVRTGERVEQERIPFTKSEIGTSYHYLHPKISTKESSYSKG